MLRNEILNFRYWLSDQLFVIIYLFIIRRILALKYTYWFCFCICLFSFPVLCVVGSTAFFFLFWPFCLVDLSLSCAVSFVFIHNELHMLKSGVINFLFCSSVYQEQNKVSSKLVINNPCVTFHCHVYVPEYYYTEVALEVM